MSTKGPGEKPEKPTLEDDLDVLLDALGKDDLPTEPISSVPPTAHPHQGEADEDGRPTPVMPGAVADPSDEPATGLQFHAADSQSPTRRAPEGEFKKLFALSNPSSFPPPDPAVREVAEVVAGKHPSLRASPVPRMYVESEQTVSPIISQPVVDGAPEIEITGSVEIPTTELGEQDAAPAAPAKELTQEDIKKIIDQCLFLYREMNMDFSSVYSHALGFKVKEKRIGSKEFVETYMSHEKVAEAIYHFLQSFTSALARHLLEGKTNVVQTKIGILANKMFHKVARFGAQEVICDPMTLKHVRLMQQLLQSIPPVRPEFVPDAEAFIDALDVSEIR